MFVEDMNSGGYPESKHEIKMDSIEFENFREDQIAFKYKSISNSKLYLLLFDIPSL